MERTTGAVIGILLTFMVSGTGAAESDYPRKPIRLIVPFVPGGPSDILARLVGAKLSVRLGEQVIPDNRGSAGGIVGFELAAQAAPDGYTLLLAVNSGLTINPYAYKTLPYNVQRDFQPISQLTIGGNVLSVHPSVAAKTLQEFIQLAKSMPGKINYASTGTGNLLATEKFRRRAGIDIVGIPYKGTGQAVIALLANEVQLFSMNPLVAVPNVKAGKLRALAVTSAKRNPVLPDVPTVAEAALPGYESVTWHNIVVPAGTPKAIVNRLNAEIVKIMHLPDVREFLISQGLAPVGSTPEELSAHIKEESKMYAALIKEIGFEPL